MFKRNVRALSERRSQLAIVLDLKLAGLDAVRKQQLNAEGVTLDLQGIVLNR